MKKILLLAILAALLAAGCSEARTEGPADKTGKGSASVITEDGQMFVEDKPVKGSGPVSVTESEQQKQGNALAAAEKGAENQGDLVIKSDNQVHAGSKQAMINELDKEINGLVDALNKLEDVNESDLTME